MALGFGASGGFGASRLRTVRLTERDVLPWPFVVLVKLTVSEWTPGARRVALLLIVTETLVLAPADNVVRPLRPINRLTQL
jgi:hypothetical protein